MNPHQRALDPGSADTADSRQFESPAKNPAKNKVTLTEVKAAGKAEDTAENAWLDLPLPDALPAEAFLDDIEGRRMHAILSGLLHALALDHSASLGKLDELLGELGRMDCGGTREVPVDIDTSGLPLTVFQATDYDRYFRVNRRAAAEPATAMVLSLIQTVRAVTHLFERSKDLPAIHVRRQVEGFISHTHLLARTFGLEPLE